jgi:hypothetical protein
LDEKLLSPARNTEDQRAWKPPVIEELDFNATEVAYGIDGVTDLGFYTV